MSQWKGGSQSISLLEGTVKTPSLLEDGVKFFSHEFVQLIWLREKDVYEEENLQHKQTYIPKMVTNEESCFCGFEIGPQQPKCHYCSHQYMDEIDKSVKLGKRLVDKKLL